VSVLKPFAILLTLLVFVSPVFAFGDSALSSENVAASAISMAEESVVSSYQAVLEAEAAGANVSDLLARLNVAVEDLAQAHISYRLGDFDGAGRFASLCIDVGEAVKIEAYKLRDLAVEGGRQRFWWTMVGSIIGVGAVVCGSFLGWRVFQRRYFQRVFGMKPEVVSDES